MRLAALAIGVVLAVAAGVTAKGAENHYAYNLTAATDFDGVYLAPAGTANWGPNQALNDNNKALEFGERLTLTGIDPGNYDVKLVDAQGRTCVMRGVNMTKTNSFEIRDADLSDCK